MAAHSSLSPKALRAAARAIRAMERELLAPDGPPVTSPGAARTYLRCRISGLQREEFHALWLNSAQQLIAAETLFVGTTTQTAVHIREVVKSAIRHNATGVIIAHNHPGGTALPSSADLFLTEALRNALNLIEVRLLDHFIVTDHDAVSMLERGQL